MLLSLTSSTAPFILPLTTTSTITITGTAVPVVTTLQEQHSLLSFALFPLFSLKRRNLTITFQKQTLQTASLDGVVHAGDHLADLAEALFRVGAQIVDVAPVLAHPLDLPLELFEVLLGHHAAKVPLVSIVERLFEGYTRVFIVNFIIHDLGSDLRHLED